MQVNTVSFSADQSSNIQNKMSKPQKYQKNSYTGYNKQPAPKKPAASTEIKPKEEEGFSTLEKVGAGAVGLFVTSAILGKTHGKGILKPNEANPDSIANMIRKPFNAVGEFFEKHIYDFNADAKKAADKVEEIKPTDGIEKLEISLEEKEAEALNKKIQETSAEGLNEEQKKQLEWAKKRAESEYGILTFKNVYNKGPQVDVKNGIYKEGVSQSANAEDVALDFTTVVKNTEENAEEKTKTLLLDNAEKTKNDVEKLVDDALKKDGLTDADKKHLQWAKDRAAAEYEAFNLKHPDVVKKTDDIAKDVEGQGDVIVLGPPRVNANPKPETDVNPDIVEPAKKGLEDIVPDISKDEANQIISKFKTQAGAAGELEKDLVWGRKRATQEVAALRRKSAGEQPRKGFKDLDLNISIEDAEQILSKFRTQADDAGKLRKDLEWGHNRANKEFIAFNKGKKSEPPKTNTNPTEPPKTSTNPNPEKGADEIIREADIEVPNGDGTYTAIGKTSASEKKN